MIHAGHKMGSIILLLCDYGIGTIEMIEPRAQCHIIQSHISCDLNCFGRQSLPNGCNHNEHLLFRVFMVGSPYMHMKIERIGKKGWSWPQFTAEK